MRSGALSSLALICVAGWGVPAAAQSASELIVLTGSRLAEGFSLGVDSSGGRRDWVSSEGEANLLMQYPSGQSWGAVLITVGAVSELQTRDMSAYQALTFEISGDPGVTVGVGVKDTTGTGEHEAKANITVSSDWRTYSIPLSQLTGAVDLTRIHVVALFAFSGAQAHVVRVRNVKHTVALTRILPQLAFGGGWYTALYVTNTTDSELSVQANFIGNDGQPLQVESIGDSKVTVHLAGRGTAIVEAPNSGALRQGYISASLPSVVVGYGVFRSSSPGITDQEAVVPLSGASAKTARLIWDETSFVTAVAVVNPSPLDSVITVTVRNGAGSIIGTSTIALVAGAKTAVALRSLPGLEGMPGNRGSAEFVANPGTLAVLGLRFNGQAFTSIPALEQ
jgi:hypothetical protein